MWVCMPNSPDSARMIAESCKPCDRLSANQAQVCLGVSQGCGNVVMGLSMHCALQTQSARPLWHAGHVQNAPREYMLDLSGLEIRVIAMATGRSFERETVLGASLTIVFFAVFTASLA